MDPAAVVQRQLDAYNAHDLDAFIACFAEDARLHRMPQPEPTLVGREAIAEFYRTQRFAVTGLRADLLGRFVLGTKVVDHERIHGLDDAPSEVVAVYEVRTGRIVTVWFFAP